MLIPLLVFGGMLSVVGAVSPAALLVVLRDGVVALAVLLSATGLGSWCVRALGISKPDPVEEDADRRATMAWHLLMSAGLGLGAVSLLMLGLGALGILHRAVWIGLMTLFASGGLLNIRHALRGRVTRKMRATTGDAPWMRWLWLGVIGFGALALLGGTMPPGILWPAEGNGYDVLEYHLGVPREHWEAGRIAYLPHNIYGNFPMNVEMLYLLAIDLHGDPLSAVFSAKLLNVFLGMLAVAAVWLTGRQFGRASGITAGVVAASCPFMTYLCGIAYVENGLLLYTALALAAVLRAARSACAASSRWVFASGLLSGLACGCKYTAIPAVFLPLICFVTWRAIRRRPRMLRLPLCLLAGWIITFGPWLAKNALFTGNPVFPLARGIFPERAGIWSDALAAQWQEGHLPAPGDRTWDRRLWRFWQEVVGSRMYGPGFGLAIAAGLAGTLRGRRRRISARRGDPPGSEDRPDLPDDRGECTACWWMIIIGVAFWMGWTHLVGRFALTLLVPAAVIAGHAMQSLRGPTGIRLATAGLLVVVTWNTVTTVRLFTEPPFLALGVFGRTDLITRGDWPGQAHLPDLNALTAQGHRILMVGDARRFYLDKGVDFHVVFNRNPFAEAAAGHASARLLDGLRERGYRYLHVDWNEMWRLRNSRYGFWPAIDPELFQRLSAAGLEPVRSFTLEGRQAPYATLFEIPPGRP